MEGSQYSILGESTSTSRSSSMFRRSVSFVCSSNDCLIASRMSASRISSDTTSASVSCCCPSIFPKGFEEATAFVCATSWSNSSSFSMYSKLSVMIRYPAGYMIPAKSDSMVGSRQKASPVCVAKTRRSPNADDELEIKACTPSDLGGNGNEMAGTTLASSTLQICNVSVNSLGPFCATPTTYCPISSSPPLDDVTSCCILSISFNQSS